MSNKELNVLLLGEQTDRDTARDDLAGTDLAAAGNDYSLDFSQPPTKIPVTTASFGKHAAIPGMGEVNLKAFTYLSDNGTSQPMFESLLKSCGFKVATVGGERTYTPSSDQADWTYLSAWSYLGDKVAGQSMITKASSILCDGTIEGTLGEPMRLSCTGKGVPVAAPSCGNYVSGSIVLPSDTIPPMLRASAMSAMGFSWDIIKFSVAFKNSVLLIKETDDSFPFGYRYADIADRDFEIKLTVYQTTDLPFSALGAGTLGSFNICVGATGAKVRIYSPSTGFQITEVAPGVDAGQNTFEITGTIEYEDFAIKTGET